MPDASTPATADDLISFADLAHELGKNAAPLANALRVHLGISKTDVATAMVSRSSVESELEAMHKRPAKWAKKAKA